MRYASILIVVAMCAQTLDAADVELRKFANVFAEEIGRPNPTVLRPGVQNFVYALNVANLGPDGATNVTIIDPLPAQVAYVGETSVERQFCTGPAVGSSGTISCTIPSLASGDSVLLIFSVRLRDDALAFTRIVNTATVTSATPDANLANNTATASVAVEANVPLSREALLLIALAIGAIALRRLAR